MKSAYLHICPLSSLKKRKLVVQLLITRRKRSNVLQRVTASMQECTEDLYSNIKYLSRVFGTAKKTGGDDK